MKARKLLLRSLLNIGLLAAGAVFVPSWWCGRSADKWFDGDRRSVSALSKGVEKWVVSDLDRALYSTGSTTFDGEWLFGTYMMAGMGLGQAALQHPELRATNAALVAMCVEKILSDKVRAFDREMWREDAMESLDGPSGHAAYLGYLNLVLGMHRMLDRDSKYADLNDRVTAVLARRVGASPTLLIDTYPNECYPVDNCAVIGSIGLSGLAGGADRSELVARWSAKCRKEYIDPRSGALFQAVDSGTGMAYDAPRGSGTAFGLYLVSFADFNLSSDLYQGMKKNFARSFMGFGLVREYPGWIKGGHGDIDSGPVLWGYGLSPTGFLLAGARMHGDRECFSRLYATAHAGGAPWRDGDALHFLSGASLADSIMLGMLTARNLGREVRP